MVTSVIYERNGEPCIGRIIARGGDVVDCKNNSFTINDAPDSTSYYGENEMPESSGLSYPYTLGDDQVFVVGDNRGEVADSRLHGGISKSEIKGKIIGIFRLHAF